MTKPFLALLTIALILGAALGGPSSEASSWANPNPPTVNRRPGPAGFRQDPEQGLAANAAGRLDATEPQPPVRGPGRRARDLRAPAAQPRVHPPGRSPPLISRGNRPGRNSRGTTGGSSIGPAKRATFGEWEWSSECAGVRPATRWRARPGRGRRDDRERRRREVDHYHSAGSYYGDSRRGRANRQLLGGDSGRPEPRFSGACLGTADSRGGRSGQLDPYSSGGSAGVLRKETRTSATVTQPANRT